MRRTSNLWQPTPGLRLALVSQDEGQAFGLGGVSQLVPAEHAFGTDRNAVAARLNELEEVFEVVGCQERCLKESRTEDRLDA